MCSAKKPKIPEMPAPAPTLPPLLAPSEPVESQAAAAADKKRQQAAAYGRGKTILTGSEGDTASYKAEKKSLLGL